SVPATWPTAARSALLIACERATARLPPTMTACPSADTVARRASARTARRVKAMTAAKAAISVRVRPMRHDYGAAEVIFRAKSDAVSGGRLFDSDGGLRLAAPERRFLDEEPGQRREQRHQHDGEAHRRPRPAREEAEGHQRLDHRPVHHVRAVREVA